MLCACRHLESPVHMIDDQLKRSELINGTCTSKYHLFRSLSNAINGRNLIFAVAAVKMLRNGTHLHLIFEEFRQQT